MKPIAFLDANILVPYNLMSLLLTMADFGLLELRWSKRVLEETSRALTDRIGITSDQAQRRIGAMQRAFPEAMVDEEAVVEEGLDCHPKDRHVLAGAVAGGATHLVTVNLRDFPDQEVERFGIELVHPETFLLKVLVANPDEVRDAVDAEAARRVNPPMSRRDFLATLTPFAPTFANLIHQWGDTRAREVSDVPAVVEVADEEMLPAKDELNALDPWHVALLWSAALRAPEFAEALRALTAYPPAFGDYQWAVKMLDGLGLSTIVHGAVDSDRVAYARFLPVGERSYQVFAPSRLERAVYLTLARLQDGTWRVWGLGPEMVSAKDVR